MITFILSLVMFGAVLQLLAGIWEAYLLKKLTKERLGINKPDNKNNKK